MENHRWTNVQCIWKFVLAMTCRRKRKKKGKKGNFLMGTNHVTPQQNYTWYLQLCVFEHQGQKGQPWAKTVSLSLFAFFPLAVAGKLLWISLKAYSTVQVAVILIEKQFIRDCKRDNHYINIKLNNASINTIIPNLNILQWNLNIQNDCE